MDPRARMHGEFTADGRISRCSSRLARLMDGQTRSDQMRASGRGYDEAHESGSDQEYGTRASRASDFVAARI